MLKNMNYKKTIIICQSIHHGNTRKVAEEIAKELNIEVKKPADISVEDVAECELVGFGSGIYDDKHHISLIDLAGRLPDAHGKKAFIFSTSGVPVKILGDRFLQNYRTKAHHALREVLVSKGYLIVAELILPGYNTNVFLKYFGGLNKNRPNENDLEKAKEFAKELDLRADHG
jgi:flavodoxin